MRRKDDGCGNPAAVDPANGDILSLIPYPTIRQTKKRRCACTIVSLSSRTGYCNGTHGRDDTDYRDLVVSLVDGADSMYKG